MHGLVTVLRNLFLGNIFEPSCIRRLCDSVLLAGKVHKIFSTDCPFRLRPIRICPECDLETEQHVRVRYVFRRVRDLALWLLVMQ
jgi:hypothetical protein